MFSVARTFSIHNGEGEAYIDVRAALIYVAGVIRRRHASSMSG